MSSSLVLSGRPTEQSQIESLQRELFARNKQLNDAERKIQELEAEINKERLKCKQIERGILTLREILTPLHRGLKMVFGEFDGMDLPETAAQPSQASPAKSAVWESWKQKLGGKPAEAIDVLLLHGEMNAKQLRLHLHCGNDYIYNVISKLHTHSLINKNGGKISLKEL